MRLTHNPGIIQNNIIGDREYRKYHIFPTEIGCVLSRNNAHTV